MADQGADMIQQVCSICKKDFNDPKTGIGFFCVNPFCEGTPQFLPPSTAELAEPFRSNRPLYHQGCMPGGAVDSSGNLLCPVCHEASRAALEALQVPGADHHQRQQPPAEQQQQEPPEGRHPPVDDQRAAGLAAAPSDLPGPGNRDLSCEATNSYNAL
jgi:hypothetical protein